MFNITKVKLLIGILITLILVLFLTILIFSTNTRVMSVSPEPNTKNISRSTQIIIRFNQAIDPNKISLTFQPVFKYTLQVQESNSLVIIKPTFPLSDRTTYLLKITSPVNFQSLFTTELLADSDQVGQSNQYRQSANEINEKEKNIYQKAEAISDMRKSLPLTTPTFSARYIIASDSYLVALTDSDKQKAKNDFLSWLREQSIDPNKITIFYTDTINFTIASINLSNKPISIVDNIKIIFTDPIKANNGIKVKINPDTKVLLNFNKSLTELTIVPQDTWKSGESYQLTILSSTENQNGQKLEKDYQYNLKISSYQGM